MVLFFLLAFSSALYRDLTTGNITNRSSSSSGSASLSFSTGRYLAFALCVAIAAQFKLQPSSSTGCCSSSTAGRGGSKPGAGLAGFLGLFSLNFLLAPGLTRSFLSRISTMEGNLDERGPFNPSLLAFVHGRDRPGVQGLHGLVPTSTG
jgi:hypothetical protein